LLYTISVTKNKNKGADMKINVESTTEQIESKGGLLLAGKLASYMGLYKIISGCATTGPLENSVQLELGGTLPPEVLSYFNADELKDIEAKFLVVQGGMQVSSGSLAELISGRPAVVDTAILITVGKDYRIVQMSRYVNSYTDTNGKPHPAEHRKLNNASIVPNMATKYNGLQEARLAAEMSA
jgi:hypothetical protein